MPSQEGEKGMHTGYRIGAVARLTGISTDTIRAWERRYKVVTPVRGDNNNRYYSDPDVKKLISIKRLVDAGQAIGTVCSLSDEELQKRTSGLLGIDRQLGTETEWAVYSVQQPEWLKACVSAQTEHEVSWYTALQDIDVERFGFVVVDMPSLSEVNEKEILSSFPGELAERCLVVYRFAARTQLRSLNKRGFKLLKGPLEPFALVNLLGAESEQQQISQRPRQFSDMDLAIIAAKSERSPHECPKHVIELISLLNQFEDYARESVPEQDADALMLERLSQHTSTARATMENALKELLRSV